MKDNDTTLSRGSI